jgi:hypothetical protein
MPDVARAAGVVVLLSLLWAMPAIAQATLDGLRAKAVQGDLDAQRNLAGCLGEEPGECPIEPAPNPVEACTWRMIIATSEHPKVADADTEAYQRDCSFQAISQLEQAAALAEAQRLFSELYKRDMPVKRLLQPERKPPA